MLIQPATPFIYEVVEETTEQTTVVDVLLGAFAVIGVLIVIGLVLGLVCAGALILLRKVRGQDNLSGDGGERTRLGLNRF